MGGKLPSDTNLVGIPKITAPSSGSMANKEPAVTREEERLRIEKVGDALRLVKVRGK